MPRASTVHAVIAIGIDLGKNTLHMIGLDSSGAIVLREKVSRGRIASRLANLPPCLIGIEAGMATHYVARELTALGHDVKQVPATYAKPFRQGHKNDFRDAHAVAEAVQRPTTRFVPAKTDEQLDLQASRSSGEACSLSANLTSSCSNSVVRTAARRIMLRSAALVLSSPPRSDRCAAITSLHLLTHRLRARAFGRGPISESHQGQRP
jgi:hypothetical protein